MTNEQRIAELEVALQGMKQLVEAWQHGILKQIGITWIEDPPALLKARELLKGR